MQIKMVGICGGAWGDGGVGKTTVANILAKKMGFYPMSFVDPVKDLAKKFFGWDGKMDSDARILLDRICRLGRGISEDYWMNLTLARIPSEVDKVVFDDVMFDNEAKMIVSAGGVVVRVEKTGHSNPLMPCDLASLDNNGSLIDLNRMAVLIVAQALSGV
jgi:hypothetical protein